MSVAREAQPSLGRTTRDGSAMAILLWMTLAQAGATLDQQGLGGLAPFFASALRLDHAGLGVLYGAIYLGSTLFTAPSGLLVDRYGEKTVVLISGLAMGAAVALGALLPSHVWLIACLFVFGCGFAASSPAGGRAILRWFTRNRGFAMGIRQGGAPVGGTLGAIVLPLIALHAGYRAALVAGGAVCALTALVAVWRYREPPGAHENAAPTQSLGALLRGMSRFVVAPRSAVVNVTAFLLACGQYTAVAFIIVGLLHQGAPPAIAAASLAVMQGTAIVARPLWGIASDRIFGGDRAVPLALIGLLGAVSLWALGGIHAGYANPLAVFAIGAGLGASTIGFTGLVTAIFAEIGGVDAAGSSLGVGLTFNYAAGFVAPPLFGAMVDAHGFPFAWRLLAGVLILAAALVLTVRGKPAPTGSPHPAR
ncbi:MAG TPA: MFS transporter [Candidatus Limnocylindria bacterium]|nr:MFS transporter [Candidatus Limnocylindria bacterium]